MGVRRSLAGFMYATSTSTGIQSTFGRGASTRPIRICKIDLLPWMSGPRGPIQLGSISCDEPGLTLGTASLAGALPTAPCPRIAKGFSSSVFGRNRAKAGFRATAGFACLSGTPALWHPRQPGVMLDTTPAAFLVLPPIAGRGRVRKEAARVLMPMGIVDSGSAVFSAIWQDPGCRGRRRIQCESGTGCGDCTGVQH